MLDFLTEHVRISYPRGLFIEPAAVRMHGDMFVFLKGRLMDFMPAGLCQTANRRANAWPHIRFLENN